MHTMQQHRKGGAKGQGLSTTDLAKMMQLDGKKWVSKGPTDSDKSVLKAETFKSSSSYFKLVKTWDES